MFSNIKKNNKNNNTNKDQSINKVISILDEMLEHNNIVRNNIVKVIKEKISIDKKRRDTHHAFHMNLVQIISHNTYNCFQKISLHQQ